jgi:hypothetical protein
MKIIKDPLAPICGHEEKDKTIETLLLGLE